MDKADFKPWLTQGNQNRQNHFESSCWKSIAETWEKKSQAIDSLWRKRGKRTIIIYIAEMKALYPIKKEFVKRIFDGSKAYEYRKSLCSDNVDKIVIYESCGRGLVVGEFDIVGRICDSPGNLWEKTKDYAGISKKGLL